MTELERFLTILAKRLDSSAYPENGPFGRAELAEYLLESHAAMKDEIAAEEALAEEEAEWERQQDIRRQRERTE